MRGRWFGSKVISVQVLFPRLSLRRKNQKHHRSFFNETGGVWPPIDYIYLFIYLEEFKDATDFDQETKKEMKKIKKITKL
jgi:hypothetical protein